MLPYVTGCTLMYISASLHMTYCMFSAQTLYLTENIVQKRTSEREVLFVADYYPNSEHHLRSYRGDLEDT